MAEQSKASKPEAQAEVRSPQEWARAKGQFIEFKGVADPELGTGSHYTWQHACAAVMHGWREHEHQAGAPIQITEVDYLAALDAAAPKVGLPKRHGPAASPHAPSLKE